MSSRTSLISASRPRSRSSRRLRCALTASSYTLRSRVASASASVNIAEPSSALQCPTAGETLLSRASIRYPRDNDDIR
eukprot:5230872-Prymnesium_polylepis.1